MIDTGYQFMKIIENGLKLEYEGKFDEAVEYYMTNEYYFFDLVFHPYIILNRLIAAKKVYLIDTHEYDWYDYIRYGFSLRFVAIPNTEEAIDYVLAARTVRKDNHTLFYEFLRDSKYSKFRTRTLSAIFNYPVVPSNNGFTNRITAEEELVTLLKNIAVALNTIKENDQNVPDDYNIIAADVPPFPKFKPFPSKEYKKEFEKYSNDANFDVRYWAMLFLTSRDSLYVL